jgi:plastocyanin
MKQFVIAVLLPGVVLAAIGCDMNKVDPGGGASSDSVVTVRSGSSAAPTGGDSQDPAAAASSAGGAPGKLIGTIKFAGAPPALAPKATKGNAKDPAVCAKDADIPDESLIVGSGGGLQHVFIYLDKAPEGATAEMPEIGVFDQKACIFTSHSFLAIAGVEFEVKNSDAAAHNVHTFPQLGAVQNFGMEPNSSTTMSFNKAERAPIQIKCDIHPWMEGWALVLDHPYMATTDENGAFELPELPGGTYNVRIWHERGAKNGQLERAKVVIDGETRLDREFPAGDFKL